MQSVNWRGARDTARELEAALDAVCELEGSTGPNSTGTGIPVGS